MYDNLWINSDIRNDDATYINIPALYESGADVYLVFGERGPGKTYSVIKRCYEDFYNRGEEFIYMRTREDLIKGKYASKAIANNKYWVEHTLYQGMATAEYRAGEYFINTIGEKDKVIKKVCGYTMSLGGWLKYKSNGFPYVKTIFFDEFIDPQNTASRLLTDAEYIEGWQENLSTVIRNKKDVKIICCANTHNPRSPLFKYYGIDARALKQGEIYIFTDKQTGLKILCYWTPENISTQNTYLLNNNESFISMLNGGAWDEARFPQEVHGLKVDEVVHTALYTPMVAIPDFNISLYMPRQNKLPVCVTSLTRKMNGCDSYILKSKYKEICRVIYMYYKEKLIAVSGIDEQNNFNDFILSLITR